MAPRSYSHFAAHGFMGNATAHRAVRLIAEAAGSVDWLLYDRGKESAMPGSILCGGQAAK